MGASVLFRVAAVALLGAATMLACGGSGLVEESVAEDPGTFESEELMVNRIAYVDNTGDLLLINPDGTGEERLTGDVRAGLLSQVLERGDSYAWPTWSRDGARIAASRVSVAGGSPALSVQVFDLVTGAVSSAYENDLPAPIADGTPHYIYWSPDGRYLSFLAPTPEGLTLFVGDQPSGEEPGAVAVGAPLYYHWNMDSDLLAVHSGDRVWTQAPSPEADDARVAVDAFAFRAPAISPDGSKVAYAGIGSGVHGVHVASIVDRSEAPKLLMETQGLTAFAWSPDGSTLAVSEQLRTGMPVFDRLQIVSADGSEKEVLVENQMLAFFWSPGGDSIAWIGIEPQSRSMDLYVSSVGSEAENVEPRHLFRFSPTGETFTLFSFFDQYAYSHSIWAPDGTALVVSGNDGTDSGRRNGSGPSGGYVYVVDAASGEASRIASGKLAVWSWN